MKPNVIISGEACSDMITALRNLGNQATDHVNSVAVLSHLSADPETDNAMITLLLGLDNVDDQTKKAARHIVEKCRELRSSRVKTADLAQRVLQNFKTIAATATELRSNLTDYQQNAR